MVGNGGRVLVVEGSSGGKGGERHGLRG